MSCMICHGRLISENNGLALPRVLFTFFDTFLGKNFEVVPEGLEDLDGEKLSIFSPNVCTFHTNVIPGFWKVGYTLPMANESEQFLE